MISLGFRAAKHQRAKCLIVSKWSHLRNCSYTVTAFGTLDTTHCTIIWCTEKHTALKSTLQRLLAAQSSVAEHSEQRTGQSNWGKLFLPQSAFYKGVSMASDDKTRLIGGISDMIWMIIWIENVILEQFLSFIQSKTDFSGVFNHNLQKLKYIFQNIPINI